MFLPTSREAKYKALNAVDTFGQRTGDCSPPSPPLSSSALSDLVCAHDRDRELVIVILWLGIAAMRGKENRRLSAAPALAA